jgi:hypothetical protein
MLHIELKKQNTSPNSLNFDRINAEDCLNIPIAILRYHQVSLFNSWQTLEIQQSQTDDPIVYALLNQINDTLFNAWLQFRGL